MIYNKKVDVILEINSCITMLFIEQNNVSTLTNYAYLNNPTERNVENHLLLFIYYLNYHYKKIIN